MTRKRIRQKVPATDSEIYRHAICYFNGTVFSLEDLKNFSMKRYGRDITATLSKMKRIRRFSLLTGGRRRSKEAVISSKKYRVRIPSIKTSKPEEDTTNKFCVTIDPCGLVSSASSVWNGHENIKSEISEENESIPEYLPVKRSSGWRDTTSQYQEMACLNGKEGYVNNQTQRDRLVLMKLRNKSLNQSYHTKDVGYIISEPPPPPLRNPHGAKLDASHTRNERKQLIIPVPAKPSYQDTVNRQRLNETCESKSQVTDYTRNYSKTRTGTIQSAPPTIPSPPKIFKYQSVSTTGLSSDKPCRNQWTNQNPKLTVSRAVETDIIQEPDRNMIIQTLKELDNWKKKLLQQLVSSSYINGYEAQRTNDGTFQKTRRMKFKKDSFDKLKMSHSYHVGDRIQTQISDIDLKADDENTVPDSCRDKTAADSITRRSSIRFHPYSVSSSVGTQTPLPP